MGELLGRQWNAKWWLERWLSIIAQEGRWVCARGDSVGTRRRHGQRFNYLWRLITRWTWREIKVRAWLDFGVNLLQCENAKCAFRMTVCGAAISGRVAMECLKWLLSMQYEWGFGQNVAMYQYGQLTHPGIIKCSWFKADKLVVTVLPSIWE